MRIRRFLGSSLSTITVLGFSLPAVAQDSTAGDLGAEEPEIIVTARKRAEAAIDVPVSIVTISAADRERLILDNVGDYLRQTAGALLVSGGPDYLADISIRGQGGGRNGFSESATGIYRNGVYVAGGGFGGRAFTRMDLFDLERFEVYRGPQGALYGRNAVGGAVNVISTRPRDTFGASLFTGYGEADRLDLRAIVNVPIGEGSAARIGGFVLDQNGGDIVDVNTGQTLDTSTYKGGRFSVKGALSPGWEARVSMEYSTQEAPGFSALGQRLGAGLPAGRRFDPGPYERNASRVGRVNIEEQSIFGELDGDLGFAQLSAVVAAKTRDGDRTNEDLDHFLGLEGLAGVDLTVAQTEEFDRIGGELRLASKGTGAVSWLLGADYQDSSSDVVTANGGSVPATASAALRTQAVRRDTSSDELTSYSVFGLLGYDLTERLTASAELRYQRDTKDFRFQRVDLVARPVQTDAPTWDAVLPVAALRYQATPDVNLYARFATGFRPGGFNLGITNLAQLAYDPERTSSFEVGAKGRIPALRMRFDVAAYYTDTRDMQVVTAASTTDTTFTLQNIPGARQWGAEAQVSGLLQIARGSFRYSLSAATQDGRFDPGSVVLVAGRTVDISDARVNRARDLTFNAAATYSYPIGGEWYLASSGSVRHESGGYENATGGTADLSGRSLDGFTTVDARLTVENERFSISAFAKNLTDETYVLQQINGNNYWNERARYGVEVRVKLGSER